MAAALKLLANDQKGFGKAIRHTDWQDALGRYCQRPPYYCPSPGLPPDLGLTVG